MAELTRSALALAVFAFAACAHPGAVVPPSSPVPRPEAPPAPTATVVAAPASTSVKPDTTRDARLDSLTITTDEIARRAVEMFGETFPPDRAAARPAADSIAVATPSWDIDVRSYETHERVTRYVSLFTGSMKETFQDWLGRGSRYEVMIRAKLRDHGIPEDMVYLALVESGYDVQAYSRSAAVGMWQFMAGTARETGMRVDWWVDERRDPVKSTDIAVRFLAELREQFGSLYLAATAYNGGPGRLARGLTRFATDLEGTTGDDVFFALADKEYLPRETKNYVPQIIAAALIAKDPQRYGLHPRSLPPLAFDTATVPASTPLAAIAGAAGAPIGDIMELNPHVLRGVTPPDGHFVVRVPVGHGASLPDALRSLDAADRQAYSRVTTKKGDTMASVARHAELTVHQLQVYNRKTTTTKKGALRVGQTLLIPTHAVVAAARDVPDPGIEIHHASRGRRGAAVTHLVRRGESLALVAKKYHTTIAELARLNHLKKRVIYPGQEIIVRGATTGAHKSSAKASSKKKSSTGKSRAKKKKSSRTSSATARAISLRSPSP